MFIDKLDHNSSDLDKHTAKEDYIEQISKRIKEKFVLRSKEREEAI